MTKNEIIDYVTTTPQNTNRRILEQQLDSLGGSDEVMYVFIKQEWDEDKMQYITHCNKTYQEIAEVYETKPVFWYYLSKVDRTAYYSVHTEWEEGSAFNVWFDFEPSSRILLNEDNTIELDMAD